MLMTHAGGPAASMHWLNHHAHSPHELPHECPPAGADWSPNITPYDVTLGPWGQCYSEEQKQDQRAAGAQLVTDLRQALEAGSKEFTISPGVYRIQEQLVIEGTQVSGGPVDPGMGMLYLQRF